jgi:hypothetical protein
VTLEQVEDFTFLGSVKAASGDCKKEIKRRIGMSRQAVVKLDTIWKDTKRQHRTQAKANESAGVGHIPIWCGELDLEEG